MPQTPERNSPCPCGSGKKYKKCCMLKPSGFTSQTPFTFFPDQKNSPYPSTNSTKPDSGENKHDKDNPTKKAAISEQSDSSSKNVSVVKLLDMNSAAEVIEKLEMEDLRKLHNLIANRINSLVKAKHESVLSKFNPGNRVQFKAKDGTTKTGTLCLDEIFSRINSDPEIYPEWYRKVRCAIITRFP